MYKSEKGHIEILVAPKISDLVIPDSDWTILDVGGIKDVESFGLKLFKIPVWNHILLVFNRGKLECLTQIPTLVKSGWNYTDCVSVVYQKATTSQGKFAMTKQSEAGYLFFKGHMPEITHAEWFLSGDNNSLSNYWDVDISPMGEGSYTVPERFSYQLNLLLRSICGHITARSFNYFCEVDTKDLKLIHDFCISMKYKCYLYTSNNEEAKKLIKYINTLEVKFLV